MPSPGHKISFEASANLQRLIGRELVPNDEMAVLELVKNAYDSGGHHVYITIQPDTEKEPGFIDIRDDGEGMALDDIKRVFMFAGYSERPEQVRTSKRVPTGEKGIGRFASDKLGKALTVFTKLRGEEQGIALDIDWEAFKNKKKKFSDITATYRPSRIPRLGKSSGTILHITKLRSKWPSSKIDSLKSALAELLDPFHQPSGFEINLQIPGSEKLSGLIRQEAPTGADIEVEFKILKDGTAKRHLGGLLYEGTPDKYSRLTSGNTQALAGLVGRFYYYLERPPKDRTKGLRAAVRLYRDGFRVEPFGSPTADWLGVSEKRAKRAGHAHIVPTRLFGFIEISRREHPALGDTTSRQALLDGDEARGLVTFLREQLSFLEETIRKEVTEPRWKESRERKAVEFEQARLQTLGIMSFGLAHELRQPLQSIRSESDNIVNRLKQLNVIDKDIEDSNRNIDEGIVRIDKNISLIAAISKGSIDKTDCFDLAELIREICQLFNTRCAAQGIDLVVKLPAQQEATFSKSAVTQVLLNLLKNSIDAIEELQGKRLGTISVSLLRTGNEHCIEVTDNGAGIADDIRPKIFKKFATKKTGGWGVGLYLCRTIIRSLGGDILFTSRENVGSTFTVRFPDQGE